MIAIALIHGDLHVHAFARGQAIGQGVGVFAALAAAIVYIIQKRTRGPSPSASRRPQSGAR